METSANFAFLQQEFPNVAESASFAERFVYVDPKSSLFRARYALERLVIRIYKIDKSLSPPEKTNLKNYVKNPAFRELVPEDVWQKINYVRDKGNV